MDWPDTYPQNGNIRWPFLLAEGEGQDEGEPNPCLAGWNVINRSILSLPFPNSVNPVHAVSPELQNFAWQNGYGIFSVGFSQIDSVRKYIAGQEEHLRKTSFQDEFRQFLRRYEIAFDEQNV